MASALGLSKSTVHRVWAQMRLKPHRLDGYMASNDPQFEEKAADIILNVYTVPGRIRTKNVKHVLTFAQICAAGGLALALQQGITTGLLPSVGPVLV